MREIKRATPAEAMLFMADGADHLSGSEGLTLALALSKNGGPFATVTPTVAERGHGWYAVSLTEAHTDTAGDLIVRATAAGADPGERLLSVYSLKDADMVRVAGADQSPRDLGRRIEETSVGMRLLHLRLLPNTFSAQFLEGARPWGTVEFWLAGLVGGALTPLHRLGSVTDETPFVMDEQWQGYPPPVEGYLCLSLAGATGLNHGVLYLSGEEQTARG